MKLREEPAKNRVENTPSLQTARSLRKIKRDPSCPFNVELADGRIITMIQPLRILQKKRITGKGTLGSTSVLIKLFIGPDSARHWRRELAGITALQHAGLPTPRVLASSALKHKGHALLTEFLAPSATLCSEWESSVERNDSSEQTALVASTFSLLGKLHAAGLLHTDLHLGNFLRHQNDIFIIDGDAISAAQPGKPLCNRAALRNLISLLTLRPDNPEELLQAYQAENPTFQVNPTLVKRLIQKKQTQNIEHHLKKSRRNCSHFEVHHTFTRYSSVIRKRTADIASILENLDQAIETGHRLKNGNSTTVSQVESLQKTYIVKRYNLTSRWYAFTRLWRPSRAWNSWEEGLRLYAINIQTPAPLALIEQRYGPLRREAWIINEFCPGTALLEKLNPNEVPRGEEASAILSFFKTLYDERISHGDFKASNLFWHKDQISVIDLDAMKKHRFKWTHRRVWKKDRARLLRNWAPESPLHGWFNENLPLIPVRKI